MKHRVYYDSGTGYAALIAAAIRMKILRGDVLPSAAHVADFLRDHSKIRPPGDVHLLGESRGERVSWGAPRWWRCARGGIFCICTASGKQIFSSSMSRSRSAGGGGGASALRTNRNTANVAGRRWQRQRFGSTPSF